MKTSVLAGLAAMALAAGGAEAGLLSFASDSGGTNWTFTGLGANVNSAAGPGHLITLNIDDHNGALPTIQVSTRFTANYTLSHVASVPMPGGGLSQIYAASGSFNFVDVVVNQTILTVNFQNALFTTMGVQGQAVWGTTAALQGEEAPGSSVSMVWNGASLPAYQLTPGPLGTPRGFSFALAAINTSGALPWPGTNPGVGLNTQTMLPSATWYSEASFAAFAVPAPGAAGVLGLAGLAMARRRRR